MEDAGQPPARCSWNPPEFVESFGELDVGSPSMREKRDPDPQSRNPGIHALPNREIAVVSPDSKEGPCIEQGGRLLLRAWVSLCEAQPDDRETEEPFHTKCKPPLHLNPSFARNMYAKLRLHRDPSGFYVRRVARSNIKTSNSDKVSLSAAHSRRPLRCSLITRRLHLPFLGHRLGAL